MSDLLTLKDKNARKTKRVLAMTATRVVVSELALLINLLFTKLDSLYLVLFTYFGRFFIFISVFVYDHTLPLSVFFLRKALPQPRLNSF